MSDEEGFAGDLFGAESDQDIVEVEPTFEIYTRDNVPEDSYRQVKIKLVGSHPLWAHHLWNASKVFASLFDTHPRLVKDRYVLELGAGGALPSLIASLNGAAKVVVTDYPDKELIDNIQYNVDQMPELVKITYLLINQPMM
ncbi:Putative Nicotinamide N-methyltransferase [Rhizopus microsporus]|nr:Putative Nicotinamide N-methyltransferase [Rhizopus microsporus]